MQVRRPGELSYGAPTVAVMISDFTAAWVPYQPAREFAAAAAVAMRWAQDQAPQRGLSAVLVTHDKREARNEVLFEPYLTDRYASTRSPGVGVRPGAVITHSPEPMLTCANTRPKKSLRKSGG
jgi:hypothetical protein